ncbi:TPA: exonuclease, partial [Escherichia coli]|nr:exonuclease [Escherichia coli]
MNYLFVDGNSLGYYHQQSDKLHNGEMEVQAAFGFVKNVRRYASILHARPMILWDGFSDKRRDFYPDYKANRDDDPDMKKMKEGFAIQKPYILKMMTALGVTQLIAKDAEADDLAGLLVSRMAPQPTVEHIYLLTGDSDWLQLVRENVSWVSLREDAKNKQVNFEQFAELTGFATP